VGCFRVGFFFSFFGRIVSLLGLVRKLPFVPCVPTPGASATCGIDVTVSVSTVMFCNDISPALPLAPPGLMDALDCLVVRGGTLLEPVRRPPLMLPLSLPLSLVMAALPFPAVSWERENSPASDWDGASEVKL